MCARHTHTHSHVRKENKRVWNKTACQIWRSQITKARCDAEIMNDKLWQAINNEMEKEINKKKVAGKWGLLEKGVCVYKKIGWKEEMLSKKFDFKPDFKIGRCQADPGQADPETRKSRWTQHAVPTRWVCVCVWIKLLSWQPPKCTQTPVNWCHL